MKLAIIKYNAGNIHSVINALERLGLDAEVTDDKEKIMSSMNKYGFNCFFLSMQRISNKKNS